MHQNLVNTTNMKENQMQQTMRLRSPDRNRTTTPWVYSLELGLKFKPGNYILISPCKKSKLRDKDFFCRILFIKKLNFSWVNKPSYIAKTQGSIWINVGGTGNIPWVNCTIKEGDSDIIDARDANACSTGYPNAPSLNDIKSTNSTPWLNSWPQNSFDAPPQRRYQWSKDNSRNK